MASELTETEVFEEVLSNGYLIGVYTATKTAQSDTVVLSNFENIRYCSVQITDGAVAENVSFTGQTITLRSANTGTITILAIGEPVKSTGGAT